MPRNTLHRFVIRDFCYLLWVMLLFGFAYLTLCCLLVTQERELIQLKREARLKGGFYVNPEAKLLFIIRIRGYDHLVM